MRIITGTARNLRLRTPKTELRPTMDKVRGAVYSTLTLGMHMELPGARVLDLFAGSGAYGLEALSRGAGFADFVEKDREAQECIGQNLAAARVAAKGRVYPQDVFAHLKQYRENRALPGGQGLYDLVTADPPYERPPMRNPLRKVQVDAAEPDTAGLPADYTQAEPEPAGPDVIARLLLETPWERLLKTHGIFVLEQAVERPIDKCPGLEILRYRRYGKTLVVYYALPGSYVVKGDDDLEA